MDRKPGKVFLPKIKRHMVVVGVVFFSVSIFSSVFFLKLTKPLKQAHADTSTYTTRTDWETGVFDGTEVDTLGGDLNLKTSGAWTPRVFSMPDVSLTIGTALESDGDYIYVLEGGGNFFGKYIPSSDIWIDLASPLHTPYYGADLVVLGDYIYALSLIHI